MTQYRIEKEKVRQKAIEWQHTFNNKSISFEALVYIGEHLEKLARRYGLIKEFRENGII